MSVIYLYENGARISVRQNRIEIELAKKELNRSVPLEGVESILVIGNVDFSSACLRTFLERGIGLVYLSPTGRFFGRLEGTEQTNVKRQISQFEAMKDADFRLQISKQWIKAKLKNQITIIRRFVRVYPQKEVSRQILAIQQQLEKIDEVGQIEQLMGYEGQAAKAYFSALSTLTEPQFAFSGRSRRPPKDKFNSLLSFLYTLLIYEIYSALVNKKLHPYLGIMHTPTDGHPALCSDLMEEWRAVIADSLVMTMIHQGTVCEDDFAEPDANGGIYLEKDALKRVIAEYEKKLRTQAKYLSYADFAVSFRRAIEMQVGCFARAVEERDPSLYKSVVIR